MLLYCISLLKFFNLLITNVQFCVCTGTCTQVQEPAEARQGIEPSGTGGTGDCKPSHSC